MQKHPKKSDFRPRAHCNPYSDINLFIPDNPFSINWQNFFKNNTPPLFLDLGCGYGRFLMEISKKYPNINMCGMEIRKKVAEFVDLKLKAHQINDGTCYNAAVINSNGMLFLQNFFIKNSLSKIFVLFPDPQFKKKKKKAKLVCFQMTHIYSYLLNIKGKMYISTDVEDLFNEMIEDMCKNNDFVRLNNEECLKDEIYQMTYTVTDESTRAGVKTGKTFAAIFEKIK